jgi:hypothetical protein
MIMQARWRASRLALAALLTLACSHAPKPAAEAPSAGAPANAPASAPAPRQFGESGSVPLDSVSISIERQPCFGFCPVYSMTINGRGAVVYRGERNVGVSGEQRGTMPVEEVVQLVDEFERVRFWDLPKEYASHRSAELRGDRIAFSEHMVTDLPTTILTLRLGDRTKSTRLYADYPVELRALADSIDSKSGALRWIAGGRPGGKGEDR